MAKQSVSRNKEQPAEFDFFAYLYLLERSLPKRSRAAKLLPQFENYVDSLKIAARRPWEAVDVNNGLARDQAKTELFESIMRIDPEWRHDIGVEPAMQASFLSDVPDEVVAEVRRLLERERNFCYVKPFITLRLKGEVTLADERKPVEGSMYFNRD